MTSEYSELAERVNNLICLLDRHDEKPWTTFFREVKVQIEMEKKQALVSLSQMQGGTGCFYSLVISQMKGHNIVKQDEAKVH